MRQPDPIGVRDVLQTIRGDFLDAPLSMQLRDIRAVDSAGLARKAQGTADLMQGRLGAAIGRKHITEIDRLCRIPPSTASTSI